MQQFVHRRAAQIRIHITRAGRLAKRGPINVVVDFLHGAGADDDDGVVCRLCVETADLCANAIRFGCWLSEPSSMR